MTKAPAMMTLAELDTELIRYGWYRRERRTIDEQFPNARWVLISPRGHKFGAYSRMDVATIVLRIQKGAI